MTRGSENNAPDAAQPAGTLLGGERLKTSDGLPEEASIAAVALDEADLIERCRHGDTTAYGRLVREYQDRVFNVCWRMCGNRADAEDLTQEAFVKALMSIGRFDGRSRFYTWLFRIAVNLTISALRKKKRRPTQSLDAGGSKRDGEDSGPRLVDGLASNDDRPEERVMDRETQGIVLEALGSLEEEYRCVITLRDLESFSYEEIADILEVPTGTIKSRLHRARLALRRKLGPILDIT